MPLTYELYTEEYCMPSLTLNPKVAEAEWGGSGPVLGAQPAKSLSGLCFSAEEL